MLSRAVWSRCMLGVLSNTDTGGRWDPSGSYFLSSSRVTLGEWRERTGQLQDLSAVIWDNMAMTELADFRYRPLVHFSDKETCSILNTFVFVINTI